MMIMKSSLIRVHKMYLKTFNNKIKNRIVHGKKYKYFRKTDTKDNFKFTLHLANLFLMSYFVPIIYISFIHLLV